MIDTLGLYYKNNKEQYLRVAGSLYKNIDIIQKYMLQ